MTFFKMLDIRKSDPEVKKKLDKFGHVIVIVLQNKVDKNESESRNSAVVKVSVCIFYF